MIRLKGVTDNLGNHIDVTPDDQAKKTDARESLRPWWVERPSDEIPAL